MLCEYIGYLYDSLVKRGYIKGNGSKGYRLTSKGMETLVGVLHGNKTRVKDILSMLQQLEIEISQGIDKLEEEVIKVA